MHLSLIPLRSAADTDTAHITRLIQETQGHSVCFWCAYVGYLYKQEAWMSCNTNTKLEFYLGWLNCKAVQKKSKKLAHHLNLAKPLHCTFPEALYKKIQGVRWTLFWCKCNFTSGEARIWKVLWFNLFTATRDKLYMKAAFEDREAAKHELFSVSKYPYQYISWGMTLLGILSRM